MSSPKQIWMPGGVRTELHLLSDDTGGAFCLMVDHPPPGWELPAHRHLHEAETIHVIEGEFEMQIEGRSFVMQAGQTVHVPAGVVHSGRNLGTREGRRLVTFSPAGVERFFQETGVSGPDVEVDLRQALASARRHGWEFEPRSEAPVDVPSR